MSRANIVVAPINVPLESSARLACALGTQQEGDPSGCASDRNERLDKTRLAKRHDHACQQERAPQYQCSPRRPVGSPLSRECNTSALTTVSARSSGPARTSHPDSAASTATSVDTMIPAPRSRRGRGRSSVFVSCHDLPCLRATSVAATELVAWRRPVRECAHPYGLVLHQRPGRLREPADRAARRLPPCASAVTRAPAG